MTIKQAMILAAGQGRRLAPLTDTTPKPLMSMGESTLLDLVLDKVAKHGIDRCVMNTYHLADQLEEHVKTRQKPKIIISREATLLGNGGGIVKALPHFHQESFFSFNADIVWDYDGDSGTIASLEALWDEVKMDGLLLLMPRDSVMDHEGPGDFCLDDSAVIQPIDSGKPAYVYTGIQILHPRLFAGRLVEPLSLLTVYREAIAKKRLYGMIHTGTWIDAGTPKRLSWIQKRSDLACIF